VNGSEVSIDERLRAIIDCEDIQSFARTARSEPEMALAISRHLDGSFRSSG